MDIIWKSNKEEPIENKQVLFEVKSNKMLLHFIGYYHKNDKYFYDYGKKIDSLDAVLRWSYIDDVLKAISMYEIQINMRGIAKNDPLTQMVKDQENYFK